MLVTLCLFGVHMIQMCRIVKICEECLLHLIAKETSVTPNSGVISTCN